MALITSQTIRGRCPACGAQHASCGPPSDSEPVDENVEVAVMGGPLKRYTVTVQGTVTVMKLNEVDAERLGGVAVEEPTVAQTEAPAKPTAKKRTTPANKARTASADKDGGAGGGDD